MAFISVTTGRSANRRFRRLGLVGAAVLLTATASAGIIRQTAGSSHPAARSADSVIASQAVVPVTGAGLSGAAAAAPQLSTASIRPLRGSAPGMTVYLTASSQLADLIRYSEALSDFTHVADAPPATMIVDRASAEASGLLAALKDDSADVRGDGIPVVAVVDLDSTQVAAR